MGRGARCLRRGHRLRRSWEFRRAARRGRRGAGPGFVVVVVERPEGGAGRLGLTVSRRVGNAVVRNRVKRRVREWFREARTSELRDGIDLVVIARQAAATLGTHEVAQALGTLASSAGAQR